MAIMVEKETGESVITFTVEGYVSDEEVTSAYLHSLEIAQMMVGTVHRIVDLRAASTPIDVIKSIKSIVRGLAGAAIDPPLRISFVVSSAMAEAISSMNVAYFEEMDAALLHCKETVGSGVVAL